eukprot:TRINITY_DN7914_c0_g1_i1.p1 TRINITY_DN7914_c0_g1~~TRINITY_DN7914_c0_g1_i1.p1  ORF type:complete len:408 (+),score=80.34 TRINITY_DN7914_c0_g1_i1:58-1281(+)
MSRIPSKWLKDTPKSDDDGDGKDLSVHHRVSKAEKQKTKAKASSSEKKDSKKEKRKEKSKDFGKSKSAVAAKPTMAESCDLNTVYQLAVQSPKQDVVFFETVFRKIRGRLPIFLREDFCGTANICRAWVDSHVERFALGVDLDRKTLLWGMEHNVRSCPSAAERIQLVCANVLDQLDIEFPPADVTFAFNYSICYMKSRKDLLKYFSIAKNSLSEDGIFVCDLYGGTEATKSRKCLRQVGTTDYKYTWEQASYNPITNETHCYLSFHFPDKSKLERIFSYDWRLWTVAEVKEALIETGFRDVQVWWANATPGLSDSSSSEDESDRDDDVDGDRDEPRDSDQNADSPDSDSLDDEPKMAHTKARHRPSKARPRKTSESIDNLIPEDELKLVKCPPQTASWNVNIVAIV